jgi:hypothetical protein
MPSCCTTTENGFAKLPLYIRDSCTFFSLLISLSILQQPHFAAVKNQACLQVLTLRTSLHLE